MIAQSPEILVILSVLGFTCFLIAICCIFTRRKKVRYPSTVTVARISDLPCNRRPTSLLSSSRRVYYSTGDARDGSFTFTSPLCSQHGALAEDFDDAFPVRDAVREEETPPPAYSDCCPSEADDAESAAKPRWL